MLSALEFAFGCSDILAMFTALDVPGEKLDDQEKAFVAQIRDHGWFRTSVVEDDQGPGFSYTTGFWSSIKSPEIIVFSLRPEIAHEVLWGIYRDGDTSTSHLVSRRLPQFFANADAALIPVSKQFYREYLGWSRWFYGGDDWPCLQLIWPDRNGLFPWEDGHEDRFTGSQPNLSGTDWPLI